MAEEELQSIEIRQDFYRDSFGKLVFIIVSVFIAIIFLIAVSLYLYLNEPPPVTFLVDKEWRVQPEVPVNQPYLSIPDLLQWVSDAVPRSFVFDFIHYNDQLKNASQFFTNDGWKVFLDQLNIYANYNTVQSGKLFVNGVPAGAPIVLNQGLVSGRYGWWVQMPITITYSSGGQNTKNLTLQILVVRVSTLNNLNGVGIDNVIVVKTTGKQLLGG